MKSLLTYFLKQLIFSEPAVYNILLGFIIALIISSTTKFDISLNVSENLILSILSVGVSFIFLYNFSSLLFFIKFGRLRLGLYLILLYLSGEIAALFYTLLFIILYRFLFSNPATFSIPYFLIMTLLLFLFLVSISTFLSFILTNGRLDCPIIMTIYPIIVVPTFIFSFYKSEINPLWIFGMVSENISIPLTLGIIFLVSPIIFIYLLIFLIKKFLS
ncbi:hypothetical protein SiRe_0827 [Sulfolobus islandicus REY15A]|uniref:Uncharacterized protein n=1 Tax=Saccharolobus islandicus (strain REY15A) TaxID=930945 RepID=F0NHA3_SACI5|nr:hypothetical protein SiRe_0827 [Sulfolobus islandicus REY15A]